MAILSFLDPGELGGKLKLTCSLTVYGVHEVVLLAVFESLWIYLGRDVFVHSIFRFLVDIL